MLALFGYVLNFLRMSGILQTFYCRDNRERLGFGYNNVEHSTDMTEFVSVYLSRGLFFKPICSGVVLVKVNLVRCFIVFCIK